jgi:hypothetical protein
MKTAVEETSSPVATCMRSGWLIEAAHVRFEVERGLGKGWRVTSLNGREPVGSSLTRAVASVCRVDRRTGWLLMLEQRLTRYAEHVGSRLSTS